MTDPGCHSLDKVSFWVLVPCVWPNVEGLVLAGTAQHSPCLLCTAGPLAFLSHGLDGMPGTGQGSVSMLHEAGLLERLWVHSTNPG